jgi:hypothetical protein
VVKVATEARQVDLENFSFPRDLEGIYRTTVEAWLNRLDPVDRQAFQKLETEKLVKCTKLEPADISNRVLFREEVIHEEILGKFNLSRLAIDLGRQDGMNADFNPRYNNPVILVDNGEGDLIVVQGNHRTFAILKRNPEQLPLFAVVFNSIEAYEEFTGILVKPLADGSWGSSHPRLDRLAVNSQAA